MGFRTTLDATEAKRREDTEAAHFSTVALSRMGLAKRDEQGTWVMKSDMEQVLHAIQRARDCQKTLFTEGALVSDQRLPIEVRTGVR
jgi:hypothetical protein